MTLEGVKTDLCRAMAQRGYAQLRAVWRHLGGLWVAQHREPEVFGWWTRHGAHAASVERALGAHGIVRRHLGWAVVVECELEPGQALRFFEPLDGAVVQAHFEHRGASQGLLEQARRSSAHARAEVLQAWRDHRAHCQARALTCSAKDLPVACFQGTWPRQEVLRAMRRTVSRLESSTGLEAALSQARARLHLDHYVHHFEQARNLRREVTLLVGPPNSGKTHYALQQLREAATGAYYAPLRLLALEVRERLQGAGRACALHTGEELDEPAQASLWACTVEVFSPSRTSDVVVVDEAHMILDAERGWAWTRALVGAACRRLYVVCAEHAVATLEALFEACGDTVRRLDFVRKNPLHALSRPVALDELSPGDALVAFSRREVLALSRQLRLRGLEPAIVYGALPPEIRRQQARLFREGQRPVLVATDAIGQGLNLPIRRLLFASLHKRDSHGRRQLLPAEAQQVAARAGRYGLSEEGQVGVLAPLGAQALTTLNELLCSQAPSGSSAQCAVLARWSDLRVLCEFTGEQRLSRLWQMHGQELDLSSALFRPVLGRSELAVAALADQRAARLGLRERYLYCLAPMGERTPEALRMLGAWMARHARDGRVDASCVVPAKGSFSSLELLEHKAATLTLWLWLAQRFAHVYRDAQVVLEARARVHAAISEALQA